MEYSSDRMIYTCILLRRNNEEIREKVEEKEVWICKFLFIGTSEDPDTRIKKV